MTDVETCVMSNGQQKSPLQQPKQRTLGTKGGIASTAYAVTQRNRSFLPILKRFSQFCCEIRPQLRGSQMYFTSNNCKAYCTGLFFSTSHARNSVYNPPIREIISGLRLVETNPFPFVLCSNFLPALRSSFKKWRQRFPRLRCFSPDKARGFVFIYV